MTRVGSSTTGEVARRLTCKTIGVELNEDYIQIALRHLRQKVLAFG